MLTSEKTDEPFFVSMRWSFPFPDDNIPVPNRGSAIFCFFFFFYLIEGGEDIIGKLNLGNGSRSHGGKTDTESSNTLLRQRGVEDAIAT